MFRGHCRKDDTGIYLAASVSGSLDCQSSTPGFGEHFQPDRPYPLLPLHLDPGGSLERSCGPNGAKEP